MKRALLLGDIKGARYHPLTNVAGVLEDIYDGMFDITVEEDYGRLTLGQLKAYNMVINYADNWRGKGTPAAAGAIVAYVADGGHYLGLHNGLITTNSHELNLLTGSRFTGHPPQHLLDYVPAGADHPISDRLESFVATDEPYMFAFDTFRQSQVLMQIKYANALLPAVWCHDYGWGRVACVTPGHQPETFHRPLRKIMYRTGLWFLNRV